MKQWNNKEKFEYARVYEFLAGNIDIFKCKDI